VVLGGHLDLGRVDQGGTLQLDDLLGHRGGEEQRLTLLRDDLEDRSQSKHVKICSIRIHGKRHGGMNELYCSLSRVSQPLDHMGLTSPWQASHKHGL
jgi:hypothetical protein